MSRHVFISLILLIVSVFSCQKDDESALNDFELFGRLQAGTGRWKIEKVETWDNTNFNPEITTTYPENDFFHFYLKTTEAFGFLIDQATVETYVNGNKVASNFVEAETERVSFTSFDLGAGTVWTVEKNKRNSQIWLKMEGDNAMRIYLKPCDCALPYPTGESAG